MTFLADLIRDAAGSSVPLSELLRRVKILAVRTGSGVLRNWADKEMSGYDGIDGLPKFRGPLDTRVLGDFSGPFGSSATGVPIPMSAFPEDMRVPELFKTFVLQGVPEIEGAIRAARESGKDMLQVPWNQDVVARVNWLVSQGKMTLMEMYGAVSIYATVSIWTLSGVLDSIRGRLLDLSLELEAIDPDMFSTGPQTTISPAQVNYVYNTVIMGGATGVVGDNAVVLSALDGRPTSDEDLVARLRQIGMDERLVAELEAGLEEDGADRVEPGPKARQWLGKITVEGLKETGKAALRVGSDVITKLVLARYGLGV